MKIDDIVIKEKCILLGVFSTDTFKHINSKPNVLYYGQFHNKGFDTPDNHQYYDKFNGLLIQVERACLWADMIIFVLDDVRFPINKQESWTCSELEMICNINAYFNKCIFVKGENVIEFDKNLVLN